MTARVFALLLVGLIIALQYGLWLGKGSWMRVWDIDRQIIAQQQTNARLSARNASLDAEVRDLKEGLGAVEERARSELGMVRNDEIFFQVLESNASVASRITPPASP